MIVGVANDSSVTVARSWTNVLETSPAVVV